MMADSVMTIVHAKQGRRDSYADAPYEVGQDGPGSLILWAFTKTAQIIALGVTSFT